MSAIPFGFVGAVVGHIVMGYDLSMISIMGLVALARIVVNDSLVLILAVNGFKEREKLTPLEAVRMAGARRFRPIILTSLTTFFGLMPMIFESSMQARFLIPMAISLGFGVMFATFITLLLLPAFYLILDDVARAPCAPGRVGHAAPADGRIDTIARLQLTGQAIFRSRVAPSARGSRETRRRRDPWAGPRRACW